MSNNKNRDNGERSPVLTVRNLRVYYETPKGDVLAVDGIDFDLYQGETLGLVGESGSGKSTAAMGILQLVTPPGRIVDGEVSLNGRNLLGLPEEPLRKIRWIDLALIPQGAMNSLNPTMTVNAQLRDVIVAHEGRHAMFGMKQRLLKLLGTVGLPGRVLNMYPHELSGGMKQRVCIAMAIALNPKMIIADESTSALDVVVQRLVAQTLLKVKQELGISMIMIGHDMGLMAQMVDRIAVMYSGKIVEIAPVKEFFANPKHPYSQLLIDSVPSLKEHKPLKVVEGITHDPRHPPPGCIFQLRCPFVMDVCRIDPPPMLKDKSGHEVACYLYEQTEDGNLINGRVTAGNS
jgi:peptide/nickel transport system ATP-binding protein